MTEFYYRKFKIMESIPVVQEELTALLEKENIDFCFIGGSILPAYNYNRTTMDLDILLAKEDKNKFLNLLGKDFFRVSEYNNQRFVFKNMLIDVIYSGDSTAFPGWEFPNPKEVTAIVDGLPMLNLKDLIIFKLIASYKNRNRLKDLGDIQELIKANKLPKNFLDGCNQPALVNNYKEIWGDTLIEGVQKALNSLDSDLKRGKITRIL